MADFSLTTLFVVPTGSTVLPTQTAPVVVSTQDLGAGAFGFFRNDYTVATAGNVAAAPYFYIAQGRQNSYLQGSKRSDRIKGCPAANCTSNVTEFYKVVGCPTAAVQITDVSNWTVQCGDVVTLTLRAHSSYIDTLYFNGLTRSVTVQAPCCDCGADPCADVDAQALVDAFIAKLREQAPGNNPDNSSLNNYFTFERVGSGAASILRITGKPLTKYGVPCDVAAFPHEYDRMWFRTFVYEGPATTADFIVNDSCNEVALATVVQRSSYPTGTSEEIRQLEKNYYSYQAGYLKHLYRMAGYNQNFESYVVDGAAYTTYYIKYNDIDKTAYNWGDYIPEDQMSIIAVNNADAALIALIDAFLVAALGATASAAINACITTTSTTTGVPPATTTTTSTLIP
jgi:hypothetical protein